MQCGRTRIRFLLLCRLGRNVAFYPERVDEMAEQLANARND